MKRLIFIIASILLGQTVCAQDIIQKKDATEIQAKVLKITDTEIEYQRWDNPDGPIYTIPAEDVFTITYQNGSKEVISHFDSSRRSAADKQQFGKLPRYQGEVAFAYGSAVSEGMQDLFPRIVFETVHGVRINPYLFAGVGLGINYFYKDIYFSNGWNIYELGNSGTVLPVFANVKGYLPVSRKAALNLSWDLGAAIGIGGYFNEGTEFYTSIGPGVTFGRQSGGVRGDFSIRFQHMGEGLNASCSASESDSKIRPANFQTRHKPPVRNYRRIQTEEAVCQLQTASSHHPRHSIDLGATGSPSIRSLFPVIRGRILSGRISSDTKHSKNTGSIGKRIMPLFPLPPRPIAPAPKEYGHAPARRKQSY